MFETLYPPPAEKVVVSGLLTPDMDENLFEEDIQEIIMLCRTAGADIVKVIIQKTDKPHPATYLGKGKLREIMNIMQDQTCKTLIIDTQLTPGQIRNIENLINGKVIDRAQLILDIFALHARTREARIQVELAQLGILYPRLTHAWSHFSKQVGGIGTRGPGEKQLEVDRRIVQKKIADLKSRLKKVERSRITQRGGRKQAIKLALVGYTNVGKSSLLNGMSGSRVNTENKLFATLDTATRRTFIPQIGNVVISDTVGFLRKLPHQLVASFKSTLEVVSDADILIIVMDCSSNWTDQQFATVNNVLEELGAVNNRRLIIFNKSDLLDNPFQKKKIELAYPDSLLVSAFNTDDMKRLKVRIAEIVQDLNREKAMLDIVQKQTKTAVNIKQ